MARRGVTAESEEPDRIEGFPHPRQTYSLFGQDIALARAARALRGARPPQALLLTGPPGIGKATLAYRIARYLLTYGATDAGPEDLSVPPENLTARQIAARAHPGLLTLTRALNEKTGKLMTVLGVEEARRLTGFFGMTSGGGGWRIVIVDTADDMNDNAANALLKLLEEPPPQALLLLISNTPGRLLPTIRSRCQRLELRQLEAAVLDTALKQNLPDMTTSERAALARLAGGSIGAALMLATGEGAELAAQADTLIERAADPDMLAVLAFGERLGRIRDGLEMFGAFLTETLAARIRAKAENGEAAEAWSRLLIRLEQNFQRSTGLNMDARGTVLAAARDLSQVARRQGGL